MESSGPVDLAGTLNLSVLKATFSTVDCVFIDSFDHLKPATGSLHVQIERLSAQRLAQLSHFAGLFLFGMNVAHLHPVDGHLNDIMFFIVAGGWPIWGRQPR